MSAFWFDHFKDVVPNHVVSTRSMTIRKICTNFAISSKAARCWSKKRRSFRSNAWPADFSPVRDLKDYKKTGRCAAIPLPAGLRDSDRLPQPIFTPSTKAETGHDENISEEQAAKVIGAEIVPDVKELTLSLYSRGVEYAATRGIIICDTKFEFGTIDGKIAIVDEMLTPDSSRFWPADQYVARTNRSRRSTNNLSGTISKRSVGTNNLPRRNFRTTSSRPRARSMSKRCAS